MKNKYSLPTSMSSREEYIDLIIWASLAGLGGLARFLTERLNPNASELTRKKFIFFMCANMFVSGFSGLMGALIMAQITDVDSVQFASAGIFGFGGARALEMLAEKLNNRIP
jgi:hypothetical protein